MSATSEPLVGRAVECRILAAALAEQPPRSVVITGWAGTGRTRMAREALALATDRGRPVRWVTATWASAQVPLGAFLHLLPPVEAAADDVTRLSHAARLLGGKEADPPAVICVDDAHLLDPLSISLLHQLAVARAVSLVVTVRSGGTSPDPTAPLWKDHLAARVELALLDRDDADRLVEAVLDGDVEARTAEQLWRLTLGNPLFLRELLDEGRASGRLSADRGFWRWEGPMAPSARLGGIVLDQLSSLDPEQWACLEALAVAEPLEPDLLVEFGGPRAIADLQRRGLVVAADSGSGGLSTGHPMLRAVVRARTPDEVQRGVRRRLAEGPRDPAAGEQLVNRCLVMVDGAGPADAALLAAGAGRALTMVNLPLAQRLARASIAAGGGFQANLVLLESARWGNDALRAEELEQLEEAAARAAATEEDRARIAVSRALRLLVEHADPSAARKVLSTAASEMPPGPGHSHIRAAEILIEVLTGDPRTAIQPATELLATLPTGAPARALVSAARALAWAMTGEVSRVHLAVDEGRTALRSGWRVTEALLVQAMLTYAELTALFLAGRLDRMAERSAEFHRRALSVPAWAGDAVSVLDCGWTALARGRWRDALRWLGEAHAGFQRRDPAGLRPVCGALLATGRALVGDPGGVRELLEEAGDDDSRMLPLFRPLGAMARACGAAAEARVREAVQLSISGAELAAAHGNLAAEAVLLHHAVRFGAAATVAPLLESLAGRVDAPLIGDMAAHARAAAAGDGDRLVAASSRLESAGALLYSADAALEAAAVYERTGARRLAGECRTRAMALARECGVSDTPALDSLSLPNLTSREREVASLASSGLSNQDIADRLVLSVRTVETHLSHVYTKFGITSRAELVAALAARGQVTRVPGAASPEATTGVIIG